MNSAPTCSVIGGGVAGLAAAVFLADAGFKVTLLEASPKLGGRAHSFFDKTLNREIDNGQHIMASWYKNTFEYLNIIGSLHKLSFQKSLEIDFTDSTGNTYKLRCPRLFAPMNLLYGLMSYNALDFSAKMAAVRFMRKINSGAMENDKLRKINAAELFAEHELPESLVNAFWKPFIIAVFNAEPEQTSAYMLVEMIKLGFVEKGNSVLVFPDDFLSSILVEPAVNFLKKCGSEIRSSTAVKEMERNADSIESLLLENGEFIKSDFYISAVPFFNFGKLYGEDGNSIASEGLKSSPILSVHFVFEKSIAEVLTKNFVGVLGATIQWVFKVKDDQLCIVISSASAESAKDKDEITEIARKELFNCLPGLKEIEITGSRVVKEMRATFVPDNDSISLRPAQRTKYKNFFIAGDWTATNLPATIESAVMSAKLCADSIITENKKEFSNNK